MMQRLHGRVRFGREDGEGLGDIACTTLRERAAKHGSLGHAPALPQSRERDDSPVAWCDEPGLTQLALASPFVESVRGHETSAP